MMDTNNSTPPAVGECRKNVELFSSPYLAAFDPDDYREEHLGEKLTTADIHAAQVRHSIAQSSAEVAAKTVCSDCPLLWQCLSWVNNEEEKHDIYGVVGGYTQNERRIGNPRHNSRKKAA